MAQYIVIKRKSKGYLWRLLSVFRKKAPFQITISVIFETIYGRCFYIWCAKVNQWPAKRRDLVTKTSSPQLHRRQHATLLFNK